MDKRERENARQRELYHLNIEKRRAYARQWYHSHVNEKMKADMRVRARKSYYKDKQNWKDISMRSRDRLRVEVLTHYGSGELVCAKCGFGNINALTIDHVNGKGAAERRLLPKYQRAGVPFYRWLKKAGFPEGYQTLCMNCQWVKRAELKEWS